MSIVALSTIHLVQEVSQSLALYEKHVEHMATEYPKYLYVTATHHLPHTQTVALQAITCCCSNSPNHHRATRQHKYPGIEEHRYALTLSPWNAHALALLCVREKRQGERNKAN